MRGGGGNLGQRQWGSEKAGMEALCLLYYIRRGIPLDLRQPFHTLNQRQQQ